ncbi:hypothetical protein CALCODRAFT_161357 [Calocera cornea HHB12733]|uniref:Uncharacterized protein n=1 Tax=Calocera cornea HHB12733 TaxID=1353952 RepID=A0A165CJV8_9BASI|nr:hypothetical protein CALCODRAFT_161357 [Calocera cornea HHB12733]
MVNFDTDQPMYADQDSFQIDIKDGSEISLMEIKYSTITEMRLLQGSSAETHRIRCTTKEPPKFPGKNFQLGIAETLKTVSFDIPKESSMHWKKLMESRHETRNASVALEPISFPVEDSKTQHATSEEATTPARGKLNTVATAMIAEAAAASKPSARLDEAAEKRTPSRYIGSKSSSQKSSGDQPAARTRLAHKALPDDGSSELSEDEDPPVRLPAKQRSKKTASSISTARQPRQVENSVVSELSSPPTHNGSSHIATNSESPSPRATRKAAIVARSLIQQQQPPTTQKAPTDQTPSHDLEDTPEIIEVSAIPEAVTPPAAEAPSEPTQSSGRFSRARRHPDDGQEESPSSQDDSPPRGANKRETAAKTMRSTKPAAQAAPRKAARGAKREREDSDTANDVEADAALDHPPSKKAKVKGRGYGGRDRKDKKPTSRTTHVSSTNDATNTGGNTAEETISLSIAQPQQAVTPATPVLRRAISSESTGAPSKASSAGTSRKALRINEASETPTSRGADLNTAVDFPDLAPRVPLNDLTEDRRTIRDSDVSGQKSKGSSSGTSSGQRKRASGKPKEKAPWESRVFDAAEHLAKRERTSEVNSMTSSPMKSVEAKRAPVAENESDEEITAISPPKVQSKARFSGDPISSSPHISILVCFQDVTPPSFLHALDRLIHFSTKL